MFTMTPLRTIEAVSWGLSAQRLRSGGGGSIGRYMKTAGRGSLGPGGSGVHCTVQ